MGYLSTYKLYDLLNLHSVKRWVIVDTTKPQSVAEHSYNVAMIIGKMCEAVGTTERRKEELMMMALFHDADELITGDLPSSSKPVLKDIDNEDEMMLKLADTYEAYLFLNQYGVGNKATDASRFLVERMQQCKQQYRYKYPLAFTALEAIISWIEGARNG